MVFLSAVLDDTIRDRLAAEKVAVETIAAPRGTLTDAKQTVHVAERVQAQTVILDGYCFNAPYQTVVSAARLRTLCIDDFAQIGEYTTGLILDQNPGSSPRIYENRAEHSRLLLGPDFALIRAEFLQPSCVKAYRRTYTVLVTMGGTDPRNITAIVMDGLMMLADRRLTFIVLASRNHPNLGSLRFRAERDPRFQIKQDLCDLSFEYARADFAVSASGSTNWELCLYGMPRVLVVVADNQRNIASHLERSGCAKSLGWFAGLTPTAIFQACDSLLKNEPALMRMASTARSLVDGKGKTRLVGELLELGTAQSRCDTST